MGAVVRGGLALAAGNGGAAVIGVVLPGRFDDAMRVAVVRRYPGCRAGVRALCLSLVMLGLIDAVALAPLAAAAAVLGGGIGVRAGLAVVAVAGVAAAGLLVEAWALVSACWLLRALASFLLLGTLGVGFSFPLALLLLCAGAAAAAVPIGPAGAATQVGAGAAALIASGVGGSQALAVTLAGGALGVLTGSDLSRRDCLAHRPLPEDGSDRRLNIQSIPRLSKLPGFQGYFLTEAGDGVVGSTSLFDTSSHAEDSTRVAAEWTQEEKLEELVPNPPKVITRRVLAHETKAPALV